MSDRRCGTCRHYRPIDGKDYGRCARMSGVCVLPVHACLKWDAIPSTDYARGWRDALAAAATLVEELTHGDDMLRGLGRAIGELTPPGDFPNS